MSIAKPEKAKVVAWYKAPFQEVVLKEDYDSLSVAYDALRVDKNGTITELNSVIDSSKEANDELRKDSELLKEKISALNELRKEDGLKIKSVNDELVKAYNTIKQLEDKIALLEEDLDKATAPAEVEEKPEDVEEPDYGSEVVLDRSNTSFKKKEVESIFEDRCSGMTVTQIADKLNTREDLVNKVLSGKTYKKYGYFEKYKASLPK